MVYDWFNRTGPSPADPSATPPPASEQVSGQGPEQAQEQPVEVSSDPNAEALEWARQAYARLKAQQEEQKRRQLEPESATEPPLPDSVQPVQTNTQQPEQGLVQDPQQVAQAATPVAAPLSLLEQAAAQRAERQQAITAPEAPALEAPAAPELAEPSLGAFDATFTWSAEVLAAQGKRVDQVSLEEIDWLTRLRQGLEKTRQGLVTQLLENLGDDPLTPEVVDGLETTLLRADVGVEATDRALGALRQRLNQEVVDPAEACASLRSSCAPSSTNRLKPVASPC